MLDDLKSHLGSSLRTLGRLLDRPIGAAEPAVPACRAASDAEHVRQMQRDLDALLARHPDARQLMAHLALVEWNLRHRGMAAVERLPVRVLAKALAQLERVVWDWTPAGLAELRSRMAIMVRERRATVAVDVEVRQPQVFDVSDVDHAIFEEMERSWVGRMPAGAAAAVAQARVA